MCRAENGQLSEHAKTALSDLRYFCSGTKSVYSSDALEMARMAGRQEVYQRIMNFLHVDYSEQLKLDEEIIND